MPEAGELFIEGFDCGFLLAKEFLYQLLAAAFELLLFSEKFSSRIVGGHSRALQLLQV